MLTLICIPLLTFCFPNLFNDRKNWNSSVPCKLQLLLTWIGTSPSGPIMEWDDAASFASFWVISATFIIRQTGSYDKFQDKIHNTNILVKKKDADRDLGLGSLNHWRWSNVSQSIDQNQQEKKYISILFSSVLRLF